jgi:hypothetical protein
MIDLTNKSVDEINELIKKYAQALELIKPQFQPYLAVIIDIGVKHIKEKHQDLPVDWKAWSIVYLKNKYFKGRIHKESDIPDLIDDLIRHHNDDYKKYIDDLGVFTNEYDRDRGFVHKYL